MDRLYTISELIDAMKLAYEEGFHASSRIKGLTNAAAIDMIDMLEETKWSAQK